MSRLLNFDELKNARDLGGMPAWEGRKVAPGKLIRCGHLSKLSIKDSLKLEFMVDSVVDLRTAREREIQPDEKLDQVRYYHFPLVNSLSPGITREEESDADAVSMLAMDPEGAKAYMREIYSRFAVSDTAIEAYRQLLSILLADHERGVLWHCTAGKDRAGMASAVIEELLGVPREAVIEDYLKSNEYLQEDITMLTKLVGRQMKTDSPVLKKALRFLFGAEREYIEEFYKKASEKYGDFDSFLRDGLQVTDQEKEILRKKYLEY